MNEMIRTARILSRVRVDTKRIIKIGILFGLWSGFFLPFPSSALADTINVYATDTPATNMAKIEGAVAGDIVEIHPGTYRFVVKLTNSGTAANVITIRGADPKNRPVFDLGIYEDLYVTTDQYYPPSDVGIGSWPGGNWGAGAGQAPHRASGNWNRGAFVLWEVGYIDIEDIEIKNVHKYPGDANGVRVIANSGPINFRRVKITNCDNGVDVDTINGTGDEIVTFSHCEIAYNGHYPNRSVSGGAGCNFYTHNGTIVVEYSYVHHATEGPNFHLRSKSATIRYCRSEYPWSYHGDMCQQNRAPYSSSQEHTYIGNVFVDYQGDDGDMAGHIFVLMEGHDNPSDANDIAMSQRLNLYYNTFIGTGDSRYLISFAGGGSQHFWTHLPSLHMYNNIIWGNQMPLREQYTGEYGTVVIQNNWFPTGDYSQLSEYMSINIFGSDPGFKNRKGGDYSLAESAQARDKANSNLGQLADHEYVYDLDGKPRTNWADLGGFESEQGGVPPNPPVNFRITN